MKKKILALSLISLFGLVGCNESSSNTETTTTTETTTSNTATNTTTEATSTTPLTFDDMYDELKQPLTATGNAKVILINKEKGTEVTQNNTIKVMFGEKSFHIEQTGESDSIISTVYTDDTGKALHYFITAKNEVDHEVITDSKTHEEVEFKEYDNPFKYVDASLFFENADGNYDVDVDNADHKDDYNFLVNNLTYINFQDLSQTNDETFEEISLKVENNHITGMHIVSSEFTDILGTTKFEWDLNFDYSKETDHNYPLPSPLETKDYHRTLKTALDKLISAEEPYKTTFAEDFGFDIYTYQSYFDGTSIFVADKDDPDSFNSGYIKKEDGLHEITTNKGKYYYKEAVIEKKWEDVIPSYAIAIEWFQYDSETKTYTLNSSSAGAFGYKMLSLGLIDPQIAASTSVAITLSEDNSHVEKMVFGDTPITVTFEYNVESPFGFKSNELTALNMYIVYDGTYVAEIDDTTTLTIVVSSKDKTVTVNGEVIQDVSSNKYGELEFTYHGINYSINKMKTKLYDNTNGNTYSFKR